MKLFLFLANRGLKDKGQYPNLPVYGTPCDYMVEVDDLDDAEAKMHLYIMQNCIEKANFIGGHVLYGDDMLGYFSPDGKFWNKMDANYCFKKRQFDQIMENIKLKKLAEQN